MKLKSELCKTNAPTQVVLRARLAIVRVVYASASTPPGWKELNVSTPARKFQQLTLDLSFLALLQQSMYSY